MEREHFFPRLQIAELCAGSWENKTTYTAVKTEQCTLLKPYQSICGSFALTARQAPESYTVCEMPSSLGEICLNMPSCYKQQSRVPFKSCLQYYCSWTQEKHSPFQLQHTLGIQIYCHLDFACFCILSCITGLISSNAKIVIPAPKSKNPHFFFFFWVIFWTSHKCTYNEWNSIYYINECTKLYIYLCMHYNPVFFIW